MWFAQQNRHELTYITAFPKQAFLIDLLAYFGFKQTQTLPNGELVLEKQILHGPLPPLVGSTFDFDREHYPRFYDSQVVRKFCVPIRPDYHSNLFPEIAFLRELPLFPKDMLEPMLTRGAARTPGNTIRKSICAVRT